MDSTKPSYIRNLSDLQLPRCVVKGERGFADLMPGEAGQILPSLVNSPRTSIWLEKKRIEYITQQQYDEYLKLKNGPPIAKVKPAVRTPSTTGPRVLQDGSTAMEAGYDQIPTSDEIPEATISNLSRDGAIAVNAPAGTEPLADIGDPITIGKADLRPRVLTPDGGVVADQFDNKVDLQPKLLQPAATPKVKLVVEKTAENKTSVTDIVATEVATVEAAMHWRQKTKLIHTCTSSVAIETIKKSTSIKPVLEACEARLKVLQTSGQK